MKIGYIEYLNSQPLYIGLDKFKDLEIEIVKGNPKQLLDKFDKHELNHGQMSSYAYLQRKDQFDCLDKFCISSVKGGVDSVLLFSKKPIELLNDEIIVLTKESLTSVQLLKILMKKKYKITPKYIYEDIGVKDLFQHDFQNLLLIGDQALYAWQENINGELSDWYCNDLSQLWYEWIGLPFVFAVFVSRRNNPLNKALFSMLEANLNNNLRNIDLIIDKNTSAFHSKELLTEYFQLLDYKLDDQRRNSLDQFDKLCKVGVLFS